MLPSPRKRRKELVIRWKSLTISALAIALAVPVTAEAGSKSYSTHIKACAGKATPIRCAIKHWVYVTRQAQRFILEPHLLRYWGAHKRADSTEEMLAIRKRWYHRALHWRHIAAYGPAEAILYVWRFTRDGPLFVHIGSCESGLRPNADNPTSTANGIFQILGGPFDMWANIRLGYRMYESRGTQPWYPSEYCWR